MENNKKINLIFPDFSDKYDILSNLIIINANLYKRTNKLEMFIGSNCVLSILDIAKFR